MKHSQWQKVWTSWGDCFSFFSASYDVRIHCIAWHETFSNSRHFSHCNVPFESHLSNQAHVLIQCTDDWHTSQIQCFHYTNQNVTCMLQLLSKHTHTHTSPYFMRCRKVKFAQKLRIPILISEMGFVCFDVTSSMSDGSMAEEWCH